jgi:hypothetical protein
MKTYKVKVSEQTTRYFDIQVQADRVEDLAVKAHAALEADCKLKLKFYNALDGHAVDTHVLLENWQEMNENL